MSFAVMPMDDWQNIVDSVRAKTGKNDTLKSGEVADEIDSISVGSSENTLNEFLKGTKTEITAEDLAGVTKIDDYKFYKSPIISIDIPDGVISIGGNAFSDCSKLTIVTIPDSVTSIGGSAFYNCSSLTLATIGDGVTRINDYTFRGCSNLMTLTIGSGLTSFLSNALEGCKNLEAINISQNNLNFSSYDGILFNKDKTILVRFPSGRQETQCIIPSGVVKIEALAFYQCEKLTSIVIPNSVNDINTYWAMADCKNLKEIICLAETPPALFGNALAGVPNDCIIKVLSTSLEAYKSATNWSVRADYIIALTPEEEAQYGG